MTAAHYDTRAAMSGDWGSLLTPHEHQRQSAWERRAQANRLRSAGLTFQEVGECLSVGASRARQLTLGQRWREDKYGRCPAEAYFTDPIGVRFTQTERRKLRAYLSALEIVKAPE